MSDRFEEDLMDDLASEPEARSHMDLLDEADEADYDEADELDEADLLDTADEFEDLADAGDSYDGADASDEFEDAMADALEAADTDEFFGKIGGFLKKIGRGVGSVARVVGPIASAIPIPQAQLIGRAANLVGKVLADEGDELDAFDDLADYAEDEDSIDALAPAIATVAIRSGLKTQTAKLPHTQRKQLVKTMTAATRHLVRKHGPKAINALPVIAAHARRTAIRKRLSSKHLPQLIARTARAAAKSPRLLKSMVNVGSKMRAAHFAHRARRGHSRGSMLSRSGRTRGHSGSLGRSYSSGGSASCPGCGRRSLSFRGPVTITIEGQ